MKVLIACEYSGRVRDAFRKQGHDAWSCDVLPTDADPQWHIRDDVLQHLDEGWDLMVAHPPCTHLSISGARWFKDKLPQQRAALDFVMRLLDAPIDRIALENPISIISSKIRQPDQVIQPWWFGHDELKATCLWLKNLPPLQPTSVVADPRPVIHHMPPSPDRSRLRSLTYQGIADAMAQQWSTPTAVQLTLDIDTLTGRRWWQPAYELPTTEPLVGAWWT
jgi:hypothetical protein